MNRHLLKSNFIIWSLMVTSLMFKGLAGLQIWLCKIKSVLLQRKNSTELFL